MWKPGSGNLRFSLSLFFIYSMLALFLTFFFMNSTHHLDSGTASNFILGMGVLLSLAAGCFTWSMDSRRSYLELEIKRKNEEVILKNSETKKAEIASAAIYQCSHLLFTDTHFESLLEKVMDLIGKVIYADECSLMLFDSNRELYIAASRGMSEMVARSIHIKIGQRVAGLVARERRDFLIVDGLDKYSEFEGIESNSKIRSSIVCPLVCQNEVIGVLSLNRTVTRENFGVADMMHVSIFAAQVAQALRNAYLYQTLEDKIAELEKVNNRLKRLQDNLLPKDQKAA